MNKAFLAVLLALAAIVTMTSYAHAAAEDLFDAVKAGDVAAVHRLLRQGANVNARDSYQETPLHHAAYRGKTEVAALLIQKGAKVNARRREQELRRCIWPPHRATPRLRRCSFGKAQT